MSALTRATHSTKPTYLSLFSGIEAASVAWGELEWTPLAFAEIEKFPSAVLQHHWPHVPNLGDVTEVDWKKWKDEHGSPDVMIAGAPCQAFSVAGKRLSLEDARGNLTLFTGELVRFLEPKFFLFENVPGILSAKDNAFGCLLAELVGCDEPLTPTGKRWSNAGVVLGPEGRCAWRVLDAQWFGVAQRRRRVFVVRCPRDGHDPAAVLLECDGVRRDSPPSREAREGVAERAGIGFASSSHGSYAESGGGGCLRSNGGDLGGGSETIVMASGHTNAEIGNDLCTTQSARQYKDPPIVLATQQGGAEVGYDLCPTVTSAAGMSGNNQPVVMAPAFSKRPGQQIATRDDGLSYALTGGAPPSVLGGGFEPRVYADVSRINKRQNGKGYNDDGVAFTLTAGDQPGVLEAYHKSARAHAPAVAFQLNGDRDNPGVSVSETAFCLPANPMSDRAQAVALCYDARGNGDGKTVNTLTGDHASRPTDYTPVVTSTTMAVRRLTPRECERLQGFPDDHTRIPWRNRYMCLACGESFTDKYAGGIGGLSPAECPKCGEEERIDYDTPDGPRYKSLGNSMAVPVISWIGRRIERVMYE